MFFLFLFGVLYVIDPVYESLSFKDIWANLFAALVAVLLIDEIVKKQRLQRTERSINYVRRRISGVFIDLIWQMHPPKGWQKRLKDKKSNWDDFYKRVWNSKEKALHSLEALYDKYHHLLDAQLSNDVLEMVETLRGFIWIVADPSSSGKRGKRDLSSIAFETNLAIHQAIGTIKRSELLDYSVTRTISYNPGDPPKASRKGRRPIDIEGLIKDQYQRYESFLEESIKFRDECSRLRFSKEQ